MSKSIKLKNNTYIDSTGIVYNRTTLNNKLYAINEQIRYGYTGVIEYYSNIDEFKTELITNKYIIGCYLVYLNLNGSVSCAIVQKASNNYLSFLHFSYAITLKQYKYMTPNWTETQL